MSVAARHFPRVWAARHEDTVQVVTWRDGTGTVLDRAWRREQVRSCIRVMRSERRWAAEGI